MRTVISRRQSGYSLLQMAIAMIIIGLFAAPFGALYFQYENNRQRATNFERVEAAMNAIQNHRKLTGAYPCPASRDADRTSPDYGHPSDCRGPALQAVAPGGCAAGVCVKASLRVTPVLANPRVVVGAIPFRLLQMPEEDTIDAYGARLLYAVTESMTDAATFDETLGAIALRDENNDPLSAPDGSVAYLVLSHGPDRAGGRSATGAATGPCAGPGLDRVNCDVTGVDAVFVSALTGMASGARFFDDTISYFSQISEPAWRRAESNPDNIHDLSPQFVGVGTTAPAVELDIRATATQTLGVHGATGSDGRIMTDSLCDETGGNCFDPRVIGGAVATGDGMGCPAGTYMLGVENGGPRCGPMAVRCTDPALPLMIGVNADGTPQCRAVPGASCPAVSRTVCATDDVALSPLPDGGVSVIFNRGDCRAVRYRCDNGGWVVHTNNGLPCALPPPLVQTGLACPDGFSGTYTSTTTYTCAGPVTTDTAGADCVCTGGVYPESVACSALPGFSGYLGTATRTVAYNPPGCEPVYSGWDTSGCTCNVPPITERWVFVSNCPVGQAGGPIERREVFNPASCGWEPTADQRGSCACDTTPVTTTADHVCADPVCEAPHPTDRDVFQTDIDPVTCTAQTPVQVYTGSCLPRAFQWTPEGTSGDTAPSIPSSANYVGTGCSCSDHVATTTATQNCFYASDPTRTIYRCRCE